MGKKPREIRKGWRKIRSDGGSIKSSSSCFFVCKNFFILYSTVLFTCLLMIFLFIYCCIYPLSCASCILFFRLHMYLTFFYVFRGVPTGIRLATRPCRNSNNPPFDRYFMSKRSVAPAAPLKYIDPSYKFHFWDEVFAPPAGPKRWLPFWIIITVRMHIQLFSFPFFLSFPPKPIYFTFAQPHRGGCISGLYKASIQDRRDAANRRLFKRILLLYGKKLHSRMTKGH